MSVTHFNIVLDYFLQLLEKGKGKLLEVTSINFGIFLPYAFVTLNFHSIPLNAVLFSPFQPYEAVFFGGPELLRGCVAWPRKIHRGVLGVNVAAGRPIPAGGIAGTLSKRGKHTARFPGTPAFDFSCNSHCNFYRNFSCNYEAPL